MNYSESGMGANPRRIWVTQTLKKKKKAKTNTPKISLKENRSTPCLAETIRAEDLGFGNYWSCRTTGTGYQTTSIQAAEMHWHEGHGQAHVNLCHGTTAPSWALQAVWLKEADHRPKSTHPFCHPLRKAHWEESGSWSKRHQCCFSQPPVIEERKGVKASLSAGSPKGTQDFAQPHCLPVHPGLSLRAEASSEHETTWRDVTELPGIFRQGSVLPLRAHSIFTKSCSIFSCEHFTTLLQSQLHWWGHSQHPCSFLLLFSLSLHSLLPPPRCIHTSWLHTAAIMSVILHMSFFIIPFCYLTLVILQLQTPAYSLSSSPFLYFSPPWLVLSHPWTLSKKPEVCLWPAPFLQHLPSLLPLP